MSTTIPFSLVSNPQLLDVVDEQWMQDKLEDDGRLDTSISADVVAFLEVCPAINIAV